MPSTKVKLSKPLNINVAEISKYFPNFRYHDTPASIFNDENWERFQVLLFKDKTEDGFTTIISQYSSRELALLFTKLPAELAEPLIEALKDTELAIPITTQAEIETYSQKEDIDKKKDLEFNALQIPFPNTKEVDFKPSETFMVAQHEYAITTADSKITILGSESGGPCLILALYDKKNQIAILAHIDELNSLVNTLNKLFKAEVISKEHSIAYLAGSGFTNKDLCLKVVDILKYNNIEIVPSINYSRSIAIDARTGTIYLPTANQLKQRKDYGTLFWLIIPAEMRSLDLCYDGRQDKRQKLSPHVRLSILPPPIKEGSVKEETLRSTLSPK